MMLGGLVALIIGVIIWVSGGGGGDLPQAEYQAKAISTKIDDDIFESSEFKKLQNPVQLPLTPGVAGRDNPFAKFD